MHKYGHNMPSICISMDPIWDDYGLSRT
jgi:hypothetical protein